VRRIQGTGQLGSNVLCSRARKRAWRTFQVRGRQGAQVWVGVWTHRTRAASCPRPHFVRMCVQTHLSVAGVREEAQAPCRGEANTCLLAPPWSAHALCSVVLDIIDVIPWVHMHSHTSTLRFQPLDCVLSHASHHPLPLSAAAHTTLPPPGPLGYASFPLALCLKGRSL